MPSKEELESVKNPVSPESKPPVDKQDIPPLKASELKTDIKTEVLDVSDELLKHAWKTLRGTFEHHANINIPVILNREFEKTDVGTIEIKLENEFLLDSFEKNKGELVNELRKILNAGNWVIKASIGKSEAIDKAPIHYTNQDKYRQIAAKYPELEILRQIYGLEFD